MVPASPRSCFYYCCRCGQCRYPAATEVLTLRPFISAQALHASLHMSRQVASLLVCSSENHSSALIRDRLFPHLRCASHHHQKYSLTLRLFSSQKQTGARSHLSRRTRTRSLLGLCTHRVIRSLSDSQLAPRITMSQNATAHGSVRSAAASRNLKRLAGPPVRMYQAGRPFVRECAQMVCYTTVYGAR